MAADVATSCSSVSVPTIVATGSILDQTAVIDDGSTIFTPTEDGLYRLSVYIEKISGSSANIGVTVVYTDDIAGHSSPSSLTFPGTLIYAFRATSGNDIQLFTQENSGSGSYEYSLYYILEQLQ